MLGAFTHNLKNIEVTIPLGMMVAVTGVSGSGKSTLVHDVLYEALRGPSLESSEAEWEGLPTTTKPACRRIEGTQHIRKVILVDQSAIGRTPRSNPVTYIKAFDPIRTLFAAQPEARKRGYSPSTFSFNMAGGPCQAFPGTGA